MPIFLRPKRCAFSVATKLEKRGVPFFSTVRYKEAMSSLVQVLTTVETHDQATRIALALIDAKLAACVQIDGPIESHFIWDGQPTVSSEWRLVAKTLSKLQGELQSELARIHPYKIPEILVVAVMDASQAYVSWVDESLRRKVSP